MVVGWVGNLLNIQRDAAAAAAAVAVAAQI